jgi:hypothetical protein
MALLIFAALFFTAAVVLLVVGIREELVSPILLSPLMFILAFTSVIVQHCSGN